MKIKSIIIEDDKLSLQLLRELVGKISFLDLFATYESAKEAFENMEKIREADLIFLDIEMPDMTGIEFLQNLEVKPEVIIISGNPEYALDAFEFEVTDYILKPLTLPRLLKALNKVKENVTIKKNRRIFKSSNDVSEESIFIKTDKGIKKFDFKDILFVEAMENYVKIWSDDGVYISHSTMKKMREILPDYFMQVHRSYIINLNRISLIQSNVISIETPQGNQVIPIGKKYRDELYERLNVK